LPASSLDLIRHVEELGSPVSAFVRDCCEVAPTKEIKTKECYAVFVAWCEETGQKPQNRAMFGKALKSLIPNVGDGGRAPNRKYIGVGLSPEGIEQYAGEIGGPRPDGMKGRVTIRGGGCDSKKLIGKA
jgi:putative DNA primase/helicase